MDPTIAGSVKRLASSPPEKDNKKAKDVLCKICSEPATKDILECIWCEGRQHRRCTKISADVCNALSSVIHNIVFFCSPCLQILPVALKHYDTQSYVDSNFTCIESSLLEIQKSETKIYDFVNKFETQLNDHHKLLRTLKDQLDVKEATVTPMSNNADTPTTDSVTSLANNTVSSFTVSIVDEQNEREKRKLNLIFHNVTES